jgi:hypothetical protein
MWPLAAPGPLPWELQRMKSIPHPHYMYAGQYWLNEALRNASGVLTDDIEQACLVWVDTYCYNQAGVVGWSGVGPVFFARLWPGGGAQNSAPGSVHGVDLAGG